MQICDITLHITAGTYEKTIVCTDPGVFVCDCGTVLVNADRHADYEVEVTAPGYFPATSSVHVEYEPECGQPIVQDHVEFKLEQM